LVQSFQDTVFCCIDFINQEQASGQHRIDHNSIHVLKLHGTIWVGAWTQGTQKIRGFRMLMTVDGVKWFFEHFGKKLG
jgi:hypothetical protein